VFLTDSVQLFVDALEGTIDASYAWTFLIAMLANFQDTTNIQNGLELLYKKKFPDMDLPS